MNNEQLIARARAAAKDIRELEHESHHWTADLLDECAVALAAHGLTPPDSETSAQ